MDLQNKASLSSYGDLLTWNAFSEQCEAKIVHVVLLLCLVVVSSALER